MNYSILIGALNTIYGKLNTIYVKIVAILTFLYLISVVVPKLIDILQPYKFEVFVTCFLILLFFLILYIYIKQLEKIKELKQIQIKLLIQIKELEQRILELEQIKEPKNPKDPIKANLTYNDVEFASYCLTKQIVNSKFFNRNKNGTFDTETNIIIGIDRGGAILGGMLAKNFGFAINTLAVSYAKKGGIECPIIAVNYLDNIDFDKLERILLVDDAIRTGRTMQVASEKLDKKTTTERHQIKIACIFEGNNHLFLRKPVDFKVYKQTVLDCKLPWDELHFFDFKMLLEDKKKKCFDEIPCEDIITAAPSS